MDTQTLEPAQRDALRALLDTDVGVQLALHTGNEDLMVARIDALAEQVTKEAGVLKEAPASNARALYDFINGLFALGGGKRR
jgi:uncharacterized protein YgfB (UPF0149 family)